LYSVDDKLINEYGAVCGMKIGRRNRSTQRKLAPVPIFPLQIPHDLAWDEPWPQLWSAGDEPPLAYDPKDGHGFVFFLAF
jgi:hypothetical protein